MKVRKIIHLDLDAFFCAVEELRDSSLSGKPFAVGGRPDERGVVSSCSYPARSFGVRSAMPMVIALRRCPQLIIIPPQHSIYSQISQRVFQHMRDLSPLVEQISIDEAFLDVSDMLDKPSEIARELQSAIRSSLGLPCSLGVATNKLVAKTATDVGKLTSTSNAPPNAITVVIPGKEAEFLAPLPVQVLWGVGPKSAEKLMILGIHTVGDLASYPVNELSCIFGKLGYEFSLHAQGIDDRPITTSHEPKSISQEVTFARDVIDRGHLHITLYELCEAVGKHLREQNKYGSTVRIKLRWPDFTTITRQTTLRYPTDQNQLIYLAALDLFEKNVSAGRAVRLIGVGVSGLCNPLRQLGLWEDGGEEDDERDNQLQKAVDELRHRFGKQIVLRGREFKSTR